MVLLQLTGTSLTLALLGLTLLVGFGANWLAVRFRVPDVLWLIALGLVAGPVLSLIPAASLLLIAPVLGTAALVIILFDAGIDLKLTLIRPLAGSAVLFAIASYAVSVAVLFVVGYLTLFAGHPTLSLLFAAALGCTSGAVIIPLANRLGLSGGIRSMLYLEAAVEDAVAILTVTSLLLLIAPSSPNLAIVLTATLVLPIPVGIAVGVAAGMVWLLFLYGWQDRPFAALATLGVLFAAYAAAEALGGSGILSALVFGGVLGNERVVRRLLRRTRPFRISVDLRKVQAEISFVLRSFFLLLIGMLVVPYLPNLEDSVALVLVPLVLLLVRRAAFPVVTNPATVPSSWANPVAGLYGRGLTSAVLLIVAYQTLPKTSVLVFPALVIIVGTNIVMTVWTVLARAPGPSPVLAERRWAEASSQLLALGEPVAAASETSRPEPGAATPPDPPGRSTAPPSGPVGDPVDAKAEPPPLPKPRR